MVNNKVNSIVESMCSNKKVLGLVSMLKPVELMKALVQYKDLMPKDAAKIVFDLKKRAEGLSLGAIETNKEYPVPASLKSEDEIDESRPSGKSLIMPGPSDDGKGKFPPAPRPNYDDTGNGKYPYEDSFVNYMNNPKRKRGFSNIQMSHKNNSFGNVKQKPINHVDLRLGQPGGDGAGGQGIYSKNTMHSKVNDMPSQGSSWNTKGVPGWASSLRDKEFELPPKSIKKSDPVELSQPLAGSDAKRLNNAGDEDDTPSFLKDPNVAQTIWIPGRQMSRSAPYRTYRRR